MEKTNIMSITLNLGDCMEAMRAMPDNAYDLAIVDPPYGINVKTRVFNDGKKWDNETPKKEYWEQLFRVSKNQIVWGGNYFIDHLRPSKCFLVWDKKTTEKNTMGMAEMAWTSFNTKSLIFKQPPVGERGFYSIDGARIHPTQKSIKLYEWQLKNYAKEGDRILDTHLGSGSIAIACHNRGFSLDAWEIDAEYHAAAVKRYEQHIAQLTIF
jgi:site-specific DNA-methyltransferase (adenine-specific)